MALNLFVLVAALVIGAGGAVAMLTSPSPGEWASLGRGVLAAASLSVFSLIGMVAVVGPNVFAVAHLLYLIGTVAVPLAALLVLGRRTIGSRGLRALLAALTLVAPIGVYATHIEPFWLRIDHAEVAVGPTGGNSVRIGILSDLQTESVGTYERHAVDVLLDQEPDVVLIPGDLWQMPEDEFPQRIEQFADLLGAICDRVDHVYLVQGNTDRVAGLRQIAALTDAVVLDDEVADIVVEGVPLRIFGVGFGTAETRFEAARATFTETAQVEPVRIVVAHRPDEIYHFPPETSFDLLVAGHTHGGQIAVPFLGPLVTLSSVPRPVAAGGLNRLNGHLVYVSTGVGRERGYAPQVRFGVRPSIGVIDLVPAE